MTQPKRYTLDEARHELQRVEGIHDILRALIKQVALDAPKSYWAERWVNFSHLEIKTWLESLIDWGWTPENVVPKPEEDSKEQYRYRRAGTEEVWSQPVSAAELEGFMVPGVAVELQHQMLGPEGLYGQWGPADD